MRDANDRFFDAFEEICQVLKERASGDRVGGSRSDIIYYARRDGLIGDEDARLLRECNPLRNSLAHHRVDGRTMLTVSYGMLAAVEALRHRLVGHGDTVAWFQKDVVTVAPDAPLAEACTLMKTHDFSALPVVSDDGIHGLLSSNDLVWWMGNRVDDLFLLEEVAVLDVMNAHTTVDFELVRRDMPLHDVPGRFTEALELGRVLGALLITRTASPKGRLRGIVTPWDLAQLGLSAAPAAPPAGVS